MSTTAAVIRGSLSETKRDYRGIAFQLILLLALLFSLSMLLTLLLTIAAGGAAGARRARHGLPDLADFGPSVPGRRRPGDRRHDHDGRHRVALRLPPRDHVGDLPRGVRPRQPADAVHQRQHPEPRGRAVGRVRDPRSVGVRHRAGRRDRRPEHDLGRPDPGDPGAADRDHHLVGSDPCGAAVAARRRLRHRGQPLGGHARASSCRRQLRAS